MSVPAGAKGDGDDLRILILAPSGRDARTRRTDAGTKRAVAPDLRRLRSPDRMPLSAGAREFPEVSRADQPPDPKS